MAEEPTLSTYEKMVDVEFDLEEEDLSREAINQQLSSLFSG
jgi:hypothetical protein